MTWLDTVIVGAILVIGLFLMYKALKEPLDLLFGAIGKGIIAIKDGLSGGGGGQQMEVIRYG